MAPGVARSLNRLVHIAFENIVEELLVGSIVLLFPFWPLLRPAAWSAAFYPLICPKGRSTAAGLASILGLVCVGVIASLCAVTEPVVSVA
jgi:hypothetical protein